MQERTPKVMNRGECPGKHCYKVGIRGDMILCERCGRIKALKDGEEWKMLF